MLLSSLAHKCGWALVANHIIRHVDEPEENEKKTHFLLTSLMSKRDVVYESIYEEFQVSLHY